jgi:hypothetical protein
MRAGHVARMGETRNTQRILMGKRHGKQPLGRLRSGWEDNIRMGFKEVGCGRTDPESYPVVSFGVNGVEFLGSSFIFVS